MSTNIDLTLFEINLTNFRIFAFFFSSSSSSPYNKLVMELPFGDEIFKSKYLFIVGKQQNCQWRCMRSVLCCYSLERVIKEKKNLSIKRLDESVVRLGTRILCQIKVFSPCTRIRNKISLGRP